MTPLSLSLQAFGPFADRQHIDFQALGENPLFLINGPTGAGKSSILDAICFALYGETTDEKREAAAMRCDQAEPALLTEVTLEFRLAERRYRVQRMPRQWRPKSRGEGETEAMAAATLWRIEDDGGETLLVSKKVRQVNEEIETLTGLKVDQFRQVMVLPQGKFRELLLADSRKREEIFSQLFQTSIYKRIEDRLKQQSADIRKRVEAHRHHIKGLLDAAEVNSLEQLEQAQKALKQPLREHSKLKEQAQQKLQQALQQQDAARQTIEQFEQLEQTRQQLASLEAQQPEIDQQQQRLEQAQRAARIAPLFEQAGALEKSTSAQTKTLARTGRTLQELQQRAGQAEQQWREATDAFAAVDGLKAELQKLQQLQQKLDDLTLSQQQASQAAAREKNLQQQFSAGREKLQSLQTDWQQKQQQREALQQQIAALGRSELAVVELAAQVDQREKLAQLEIQWRKKRAQLEKEQDHVQQQKQALDNARKNARHIELNWHASQAQLLARELQVDQPCPVCGSVEHPAPAHFQPEQAIVEREQVDVARAEAERQAGLLQKSEQQKDRIELEVKQLEKEQAEKRQRLGELAQQPLLQLQQNLANAQKDFEQLTRKQQQFDALQQPLNDLQVQIEQQQTQLEIARAKVQQASAEALKKQAAVEHLLSDIPEAYRDPAALLSAQQKLATEIDRLSENRQRAEQQHQALQNRLAALQATLSQQQKQLEQTQTEAAKAQQKWQAALAQSAFASVEEFQQAVLDDQQQKTLAAQLQDFHDQMKTLQGSLAQQQKMLENKPLPELDKLEQQSAEAEMQFKQAEQAWRKLEERRQGLKSVAKKVRKEADKNAELEQQYAIFGTLSDVASGRSHRKISLQRFVLSVLLDDVLLQASQRLTVMSGGRYQLLRRDERSKGNAASGLELDVEDAYTGKTRSVATLSGGESFMAALSLALGLSDVVQAYAGGIRLDMLFIDEGFGSLDQESLDLAIRTLIDLQASGRMIGIISHVAELKEQMALRIDVSAGRNGSQIKIVAG